jgi:chromosome segregation ATPase
MPPKHRQLRAPRPKASGNAFQALVDPLNDGIHLSFDGGDDRTDGSDDNTVAIVNPRDSGPPASQQLQNDIETLEHLGHTATALEAFQTAILRLAENDDKQELYMRELNRKLIAISEGETNAHNDDRTRTDDRFAAIESKMDILLQKTDATWTENTALREAYRASREETAALKAAADTLTKKLDETIAISAPPSPETATSPTTMEEMTMQLTHVQHDIQDVLDAVRNPPNKRKRRTSDQDNELTTPTNR